MKIKDWAAADLDALYGIWTFIANHDSIRPERYEWTAAFDDPFTMLLAEPRIEQRIEPYFMARIVDVEPFLSRMRFLPAPTAGGRIHLSGHRRRCWNGTTAYSEWK